MAIPTTRSAVASKDAADGLTDAFYNGTDCGM